MTPLAEVIGFNETREMAEAVRRVWSSGFNRLPVFRGNITNVRHGGHAEHLRNMLLPT